MIDFNSIIQYQEYLRIDYPAIWSRRFVLISHDGTVKCSDCIDGEDFTNLDMAICIYRYDYMVVSCFDSSFLVLFVDEKGCHNNCYEQNGWTISFDKPKTSDYRTYNHRMCSITGPNGIKINAIYVAVSRSETMIAKIWKYFVRAQKCTTQLELDLLYEVYNKDNTIEELSNKIKELRDGTLQ